MELHGKRSRLPNFHAGRFVLFQALPVLLVERRRFQQQTAGYAGQASDCYVDLATDRVLTNQFDTIASPGNVVQCGQVGSVGTDTTFTVALGYGSDGISVGDEVYGLIDGYRDGWAAEYVAIEARSLAPKPATVDFIEAAAICA